MIIVENANPGKDVPGTRGLYPRPTTGLLQAFCCFRTIVDNALIN